MTVEQEFRSSTDAVVVGEYGIDRESIMQRLGGDEELFRSFIEVFLEDSPTIIQQLCSAVAEQDSILVQRFAHSLRGLVANFNATLVFDLASQLENSGKVGDLSVAMSLMTQLNDALEQFREALANYHSQSLSAISAL